MELVGAGEIARLLGVSRQRVHQLAERPDFPKPVGVVSERRVWRQTDVVRWAAGQGRLTDDES